MFEQYDDKKLEVIRVSMSEKLKTANDHRGSLSSRILAIEWEQRSRAEKVLGEATGVDVYGSDDYWGLSVGKYKFYFGYEKLTCLQHGDRNCSCEDKEWCFTADIEDVEVMRIPESRLGGSTGERQLLHGIGQFLSREV